MITQGDRQNFLWRPNDNSVQTRTRYDLEASHWLNSLSSTIKTGGAKTTSFLEVLGIIGLFISFFITLLLLIVLCIIDVLKFIRSLFILPKTDSVGKSNDYVVDDILSEEDLNRLEENTDKNAKPIDIREFNGKC